MGLTALTRFMYNTYAVIIYSSYLKIFKEIMISSAVICIYIQISIMPNLMGIRRGMFTCYPTYFSFSPRPNKAGYLSA